MDTVQTSDERTYAERKLLRMLEEAEENVRAGCIAPMENTFSALRDSLLQRKQQEPICPACARSGRFFVQTNKERSD